MTKSPEFGGVTFKRGESVSKWRKKRVLIKQDLKLFLRIDKCKSRERGENQFEPVKEGKAGRAYVALKVISVAWVRVFPQGVGF